MLYLITPGLGTFFYSSGPGLKNRLIIEGSYFHWGK